MTRNLALVIAARCVMSAMRAFAGIVVPIYLAQLGFSGLQLGIVFSAVALASALMAAGIGMLADRIGRKIFLIIVPLLAAAAAIGFSFTTSTVALYVLASLGTFGRGAGAGAGTVGPYQPAEQALLADAIVPRHRNALFGTVAFASSLGALVGGPLAALPALDARLGLHGMASYRPAFFVMAGLAVGAALLVVPVVEPRRLPAAGSPFEHTAGASHRGRRLSHPTWRVLLRLWVTNSVNGLAVGFFGPFITVWFYLRYGAGAAEIGALYAVINLFAMVSNLGAARVARRLGLVRAILWSRALQAILLVPMVLAPTFWLAGAFYLVRMLAQRVGLPLRQSFVMGVVPAEERGRVGALSNLPSQATSAASPTLAGYLFDHVALSLPFLIGAGLQAVNTVLFGLFFLRTLPPEERASPTGDAQARTGGGSAQ